MKQTLQRSDRREPKAALRKRAVLGRASEKPEVLHKPTNERSVGACEMLLEANIITRIVLNNYKRLYITGWIPLVTRGG